jgi:hypothetical protein
VDKIKDKFYEIALDEIIQNKPIKAILGKAMSDAMGDDNKLKSLYVKYRVEQMKAEYVESRRKQKKQPYEAQETQWDIEELQDPIGSKYKPWMIISLIVIVIIASLILYPYPRPNRSESPYSFINVKVKWDGLKIGMSFGQVESLLGESERKIKAGANVTWYYPYGGRTLFSTSPFEKASKPKLVEWEEPHFLSSNGS